MAHFIGDYLDAKEIGEYGGRTVHRLNAPLLWVHEEILVEVPTLFECDLASVPRLPLVYMLWGDRAHREAVLHDYLYRSDSFIYRTIDNIRRTDVVDRADADYFFKLAMQGQGRSYGVYQPMYLGVKLGGSSSWHQYKVGHKFKCDIM